MTPHSCKNMVRLCDFKHFGLNFTALTVITFWLIDECTKATNFTSKLFSY